MAGTGAASPAVLVGNQSVASYPDNNPAGLAEAFNFTATASGAAQTISVYVDRGSSASRLIAGLYASNRGHPGSLLASGSDSTPIAGQWNQLTLNSTPTLPSGTTYWLVVLGTGGQLSFRDVNLPAGTCSETSSQSNLTGLPSSWTTGSAWATCSLSAYVSATGGSVTAPTNTALPAISGQAAQGQTLTVSNGSWSAGPTSYSYQWQVCASSGASCSNVSGATSSSYTLLSGDVGHTMRAVVTAANAGGSTSATSGPSVVIGAAPPGAPSNTGVPVVSGSAIQGNLLSSSTGSWTGSPTKYAYQWQDCDSSGSNCANIATGASSNTYTVASSDIGRTIRVVVTATNSSGSGSTPSAVTGVVTGSGGTGTGGGGLPSGVSLQQLDGGPTYYSRFSNGFPTSSNFYPIAVFNQGLGYNGSSYDPTQLAAYKAVGANTFVNLYNGYNSALISAIKADGMYALGSPLAASYAGNTFTGYVWFDEADGNDDCADVPSASILGQIVPCSAVSGRTPPSVISQVNADLHAVDPTRPVYCQYTKPVAENSGLTNAQAAAYVNANCDIVSYDSYIISDGWTTNHNLWRQYDDVANVRSLANDGKPVMPFIEAGEPFTSNQWSGVTATPQMSVAEAWNAIIAGARGIQWFDHDFGGSSGGYATSGDDLIDPNPVFSGLQSAITAMDHRVTSLAPILNDPFANGYVTNTGLMNVMAKYDAASHNFYVFAAPRSSSSQSITFTAAGGYTGPVTVQGENRTVMATSGKFTDTFASVTAVHIYIVP
jgi:hypothetical protein